MTEASFVGSVSMNGGAMIERDGVAKVHANDIISIDEFNGLMSALNTQTNNQFESQLLAALDSGNINKDLAGGSPIEYTTNCTIWTGIQPSRLNMEGGLGRRLCHIVCTPTREDNDRLKRIMHESYGKKPNTKNMRSIWNNIKDFNRQIPKIENITMHEDLLDFYDKHDLYSYETTLFDRIAIAYAIAKDGAKTDIEVSLKDKELINIFKNQVKWRQQTYKGVDFVIIRQVLELNGNNMPTAELVSQCRMYGWNIQQVHKIIREMEENHIIRRRGSRIEFA